MAFGSATRQRKRFDALISEARASLATALGDKRMAAVRSRAEEAYVLARGLLPDPEPLRQAASFFGHVLVRSASWDEAQEMLEEASTLLDRAAGAASPAAVQICLELSRILRQRERFDVAGACLEDRLRQLPDDDPARVEVELELVRLSSDLGRDDEAVAKARSVFQRACEAYGPGSRLAVAAALGLSTALTSADREPKLAVELANRSVPAFGAPGAAPTHLGRAVTLARAMLQGGDPSAAAGLARLAYKREEEPRRTERPLFNPELVELWDIEARALAALGQRQEAIARYRQALVRTKPVVHAFAPELRPLLEGLARLLRDSAPREADGLERRAEEIRARITGRPPEPRDHPPPSTAITTSVWPRRTLAGVFSLSRIEPKLVRRLLRLVTRPGMDFGPMDVLRAPETNGTTVILEGWDNPWQPPCALRFRAFRDELCRMVDLANTALRSRGKGDTEVELVPWWAVQDALRIAWWEQPAHVQERWHRELFPALPGWMGRPGTPSWLGDGLKRKDGEGRVVSASPFLTVDFVQGEGIAFRGAGPADRIDEWFEAFARTTRLLEPGSYTPILRATPAAVA